MIQIENVEKRFDELYAIRNVSMKIPEGEVFGLVGTNGAGKSTLLRMMSGILKPDSGSIMVDGDPVYGRPESKRKLCFVCDEAWFFANSTPKEQAKYLQAVYENFSMDRFHALMNRFGLEEGRRIQTFSKGMKKQLSLVLGLSCNTRYLLLDETFDGLDPVMRQSAKSLLVGEMMDRELTPVLSSHNLRELEDICDRIGLLHRGGILLSKEMEDMKRHIHRLQCVIPDPEEEKRLKQDLDIVTENRQGSLLLFTARGTRQEVLKRAEEAHPSFLEVLPLSLEEIFISETEVTGYEIDRTE